MLGTATAGWGSGHTGPAAAPSALEQAEAEHAVWGRLRRIEAAFRAGDAGSLRASFSSGGKMRVDLPHVAGCPASYGPGQLQAIFAEMFREGRTREFTFRRQDVTLPSRDTAFARGRWVRDTGGTADREESLTFTLREEDGDWRIHEILAPR